MIALAQGGLAGEGVGQGKKKLGAVLPLAHSDFIFAVVAEELGMIGVIAVLGGFLILAYAGVQVALATHDRFASLLAGGIVIWFVVQTIINVGGVTGMMPVTGLTLPFFSAGGSSLFVTMTAAGLLLNVARNVRCSVPEIVRRLLRSRDGRRHIGTRTGRTRRCSRSGRPGARQELDPLR